MLVAVILMMEMEVEVRGWGGNGGGDRRCNGDVRVVEVGIRVG